MLSAAVQFGGSMAAEYVNIFGLLIREWLKDDPGGQQTVARALEHAMGIFSPAAISPTRATESFSLLVNPETHTYTAHTVSVSP